MDETGKKQNIAIALCMLVASVILLYLAIHLDSSTHLGMTGTRLVPVIATTAMLIFSTIRCFISLLQPESRSNLRNAVDYRRWFIVIVLLLMYAFIIETVGYLAATFALLLLVAPLFGLKKPATALGLSFIATVSTWLLFTKVFGGYLPTGTLF